VGKCLATTPRAPGFKSRHNWPSKFKHKFTKARLFR